MRTTNGKEKLVKIILTVFIFIELAIYIAFNVMAGLNTPDPIYLKYSGVLLCFAVSVALSVIYGGEKDYLFLSCALLFTAISDLFILVLDDYYEIGLVTFIITQSIYFARLYFGRYKRIWLSLAVRCGVMVVLFIVFAVAITLNLLIAECIIYISMLVANVVDAFIICRKGVKNILFAVGLLLFVGCDICVGLHNFGSVLDIALPTALTLFAQVAIWAFYLPSQVLITCSAKKGGLNFKGVCNER